MRIASSWAEPYNPDEVSYEPHQVPNSAGVCRPGDPAWRGGAGPKAKGKHLAEPASESGRRAAVERAGLAKNRRRAKGQRMGSARPRAKSEEPVGSGQQ